MTSSSSSFQTVNGGVSLFLLTFIILCLVSFAALSIVSARADARFHEAICLATRNRRLIQLLNNIREQIFRYRLEYLKGRENYGKLAAEHERILTALAGKKEQEAADAAALHIANQRVSIMEQLRREKEEKR